jgi:hypothetical protein
MAGKGARNRRRAARIIAHMGRPPMTRTEASWWVFNVRPELAPHTRHAVASAMLEWRP